MTQGRIIYDVPWYRRWRILVAASTVVGVVAALPLWGYGHLPGAPAREGVVLKPVSQGAALPHEIAADPFGVRDWPAGPVAAEAPAAPSSAIQ